MFRTLVYPVISISHVQTTEEELQCRQEQQRKNRLKTITEEKFKSDYFFTSVGCETKKITSNKRTKKFFFPRVCCSAVFPQSVMYKIL